MDETAPEKDAEQKRSAVESGGDSSSAPDPAASASKRKQQLLPKKECMSTPEVYKKVTVLKKRRRPQPPIIVNTRLNKVRSLADELRRHIRPRRREEPEEDAEADRISLSDQSSLHSSLLPKRSKGYRDWKKNIWNTTEPVIEILNIQFEDSSEGEDTFPKIESLENPSAEEVLIEVFAEGSAGADVGKGAEEKKDDKSESAFEWKCPLCLTLKPLPDFPAFRAHVKETHTTGNCSLCPTTDFPDVTLLESHLTRVHLKRWTCDLCIIEFPDLLQFSEHMEKKHKNKDSMHILTSGKIRCKFCGKKYTKASSLHDHFLAVHEDLRQCAPCDLQFRGASRILKHMYSEHMKCSFSCAAKVMGCDFTHNSPYNIKQHVLSRHNETFEKRTCPVCQRKISNVIVFQEHVKAHENDKQRTHFCDICARVFTTIDTMRVHRRRHFEEERKFECEICGKKFWTKTLKNAHKLLHDSDVKPFKCKVEGCGMAYRTRGTLHIHRFEHTGEFPYRCDQCQSGFPSVDRLNKHIRGKHKAAGEELIKKKKKKKKSEL